MGRAAPHAARRRILDPDRQSGADDSRLSGSEEALATLALAQISCRPAPRILIGGLGMGFTLRAAQAAAGPDARFVVAEIVPELVAWARGSMAGLRPVLCAR
jgi:spermidine synthase